MIIHPLALVLALALALAPPSNPHLPPMTTRNHASGDNDLSPAIIVCTSQRITILLLLYPLPLSSTLSLFLSYISRIRTDIIVVRRKHRGEGKGRRG
ncbi:hypothetical protein DFH06DRAFT_1211078 [Mycena polygramma]|nr:hypothetical protein DFH06DRAFT_1211078 [Mycena polygramma]